VIATKISSPHLKTKIDAGDLTYLFDWDKIDEIYDKTLDDLDNDSRALAEYVARPFSVDMIKHIRSVSYKIPAMNKSQLNSMFLALPALMTLCIAAQHSQNYTLASQDEDVSISDSPIYESINGTLTGMRVIDVNLDYPKREVSFSENAIMANVGSVGNIGTYEESIISSNITTGIGQGIISSHESGDVVSWNAYDLGERQDNGTYVFKGTIFFDPRSQSIADHDSNEFGYLDNQVGVHKSMVNDTGSTREIWLLN
jgi:hypothetical protein